MDDCELSELVQKFHAVQRQEVPKQISERNVVEIINVMRTKKLVDLLYTLDGKEYLTWDQLRREVLDEVLANGGRMNVVDIPGALNVHVTHVERVLPEIVESPGIRLESGELLTDEYLDTTVQAAADALAESGFIAIAEFAKNQRFTSRFAQNILTQAIESGRLRAIAHENAIHTKQFVRAQSMILRAGLLAATRPVNVAALFDRHRLFAPLLDAIVADVRGEVPGRIEAGVYVPAHFEAARAQEVENLYVSNGCVEYAALRRLGIPQAREYLLARYNPPPLPLSPQTAAAAAAVPPQTAAAARRRGRRTNDAAATGERGMAYGGGGGGGGGPISGSSASAGYPYAGHALSQCFVSDRLLSTLAALEDLAAGDAAAVDIVAHLPAAVEWERDGPRLLQRLAALFPVLAQCAALDGGVVVREDARGAALEHLRADLQAATATAAQKRGKKETKDTKETKGKGKNKDKDTDKETERADGPLEEALLRAVAAALPELSPSAAYRAALSEVAALWRGAALELRDELDAAAAARSSADVRRERARLQASLSAQWIALRCAARGALWAAEQLDAVSAHAVARSSLSRRCVPLCAALLRDECIDAAPAVRAAVCECLPDECLFPDENNGLENNDLDNSNNNNSNNGLSVERLRRALRAFPAQRREALAAAVDAAAAGKSVDAFAAALEALCAGGAVAVAAFHQPNRRAEREAYSALRAAAVRRCAAAPIGPSAADAGAAFALICTALLHAHFRVHVELPGRAIAGAVARIAKESDADEALGECHRIVAAAVASGEPIGAEDVEKIERLRQSALRRAAPDMEVGNEKQLNE